MTLKSRLNKAEDNNMPFITTNDDVKLYYEEAGSGIPIILAHEFGGDIRSWDLNSDISHGTIVSLALTQGDIRHLMCRKMKIITVSTEPPEIFLTF